MPNVMGLDLGVASARHLAVADGMNVTTTFTTASTPDGLTRAIRKASNGQQLDVVVESTAMSWFVAAAGARVRTTGGGCRHEPTRPPPRGC